MYALSCFDPAAHLCSGSAVLSLPWSLSTVARLLTDASVLGCSAPSTRSLAYADNNHSHGASAVGKQVQGFEAGILEQR